MKIINLTFPINPVAKERPRTSFYSGSIYTPARTCIFENHVKKLARMQFKNSLITFPMSVKIIFRLEKPKSVKRDYPSVRPDIDNYIKAVLDALQGIVFKDDGQIIKLYAEKIYSESFGIDIEFAVIE